MFIVVDYEGAPCDVEFDDRLDCSVNALREQVIQGLESTGGCPLPDAYKLVLAGPNDRTRFIPSTDRLSSLHLSNWDTLYLTYEEV